LKVKIKVNPQEIGCKDMDGSAGSEYDPAVGFCEYGN
jgi:hypothetical protein